MDDYNFKFRVVENVGNESKEKFGKPGTVFEVKDGMFKNKKGVIYGLFVKWKFERIKEMLESEIPYQTEIELVEESEELTPIEFLKVCHEICHNSVCDSCIMYNSCFADKMKFDEKTYEIVKQYKKDKEAKEKHPIYVAKWSYNCYLDEKLMDNVETEEQAINRCEELASENPFDRNASYKKICVYEEE